MPVKDNYTFYTFSSSVVIRAMIFARKDMTIRNIVDFFAEWCAKSSQQFDSIWHAGQVRITRILHLRHD